MTTTVYNASTECPGCGEMLNPVETIMGGKSGLCPGCRNDRYAKRVKNRMS